MADNKEFRTYRILGLNVETDFNFRTYLPVSAEPPDLRFGLASESEAERWPRFGEAAFESHVRLDSGVPLFSVHQGADAALLRFPEVAEYLVSDNAIRARALDAENAAMMVEGHVLGVVLVYWLETCGIPVLHASSVSVDGRAVSFLGTNKSGKSSLAVALMQRGHPLLSDDLVALHLEESTVVARPGFPSMRMWPDLASFVLGEGWWRLPLAHAAFEKRRLSVGADGFGTFLDAEQPLGCLYIPQRLDGDAETGIHIEAVPAGKAVLALLRESFLPWLTQAPGLAAYRLQLFSALAREVPVRSLSYPGGFEHLPAVAERILEDFRDLGAREGGVSLKGPDEGPPSQFFTHASGAKNGS